MEERPSEASSISRGEVPWTDSQSIRGSRKGAGHNCASIPRLHEMSGVHEKSRRVEVKIKHFRLDTSNAQFPTKTLTCTIKTLAAYAIDNYHLLINGLYNDVSNIDVIVSGTQVLITDNFGYDFSLSDKVEFVIYYIGIRDYELLFPQIKANEAPRAARLAKFYHEADECFESGAWLSFMLMSGAIFEHLLYFKIGPSHTTLSKLATTARNAHLISNEEFSIIESTRKARNAIHCNKLTEQYIDKKAAFDAKILIDKLILKL